MYVYECLIHIQWLTFTIDEEEVTASLFACEVFEANTVEASVLACWDPVKASKLALSDLASTTLSVLIDLLDEDMAAFFSLIWLLEEYCIEVVFLSSDLEAISDLAEASMVIAAEVEGATLGLCLHRCRLKEKFFFFIIIREQFLNLKRCHYNIAV